MGIEGTRAHVCAGRYICDLWHSVELVSGMKQIRIRDLTEEEYYAMCKALVETRSRGWKELAMILLSFWNKRHGAVK